MHAPDLGVQVALIIIELHFPNAQSLKDKRSVLHGFRDRLKSRFNASIIEVDHQDKWQRAVLAACMIGSDRRKLEADVAKFRRDCEDAPRIQLVSIDQQWL